MEKTIIVLAAGIGSRYGGFKQMDPIGPSGEFIIDYSIYDAIEAGFNRVIFIINHNIEIDFKETIGKRVSKKIKTDFTFQKIDDLPKHIEFNRERTKPWGTVHALLTCENKVHSPFIVINADDFYSKESYHIISKHLDKMPLDGYDYCMVGYILSKTLSDHGGVTRGICISSPDQYLESINETPDIQRSDTGVIYRDENGNTQSLNETTLVSMNFWGFTPTIFHLLQREFTHFMKSHSNELKSEFVIPTVVNTLIKQNKIKVKNLKTTGNWFGITNPEDKQEVITKITTLIKSGVYPDNLWK